jgi:Ca2+-binding RTX toxin-like protein
VGDKISNTENAVGSALGGLLLGNTIANRLTGGDGNDTLKDQHGNDTLIGGVGTDSLRGGVGNDSFDFSAALSTGVDIILDCATGDKIRFDNRFFTKFTVAGALSAANFRASTTGNAADSNDYILYQTDTGFLFYDGDGSGAGAKVQIATLNNFAVVAGNDFTII